MITMRPRALRRRLLLGGLGGCIAAASITTGVAKADLAEDVAFITTLDVFGIDYDNSEADAIALGHSICDALAAGHTPATIARVGQRDGGYSKIDSEHVVGAAIGAYCDEFGPLIGMPSGRVRA